MKAKQKSIRDLSKGRADIWKIDPKLIRVREGWNERDETPELIEHIETIARSMISKGYDPSKPMVLYQEGGDFYLSEGHCRRRAVFRAIELGANIKLVPVVTQARGANDADRLVSMLTSNAGKNLTPIEQGRVYKRLQGYGYTDQQISDETGKTIAQVKAIFALMEAHPDTQAQVVRGEVSASVVANAVREHGPAKAAKVVTKAVTQASVNGKSKATARDVQAAIEGEPATKMRRPAELVEFFETTIRDKDVPEPVIRLAEVFMQFRNAKISPETFVEKLAELLAPEMAVP